MAKNQAKKNKPSIKEKEMLACAAKNVKTAMSILNGECSYDITDKNFIDTCLSGYDFYKGIEHEEKNAFYFTPMTKSLYLMQAICDMKTIAQIKNMSFAKESDHKYEGMKRDTLLKAQLLSVAFAPYNIPYFAAEYIANGLITMRGVSEEECRDAFLLIKSKIKPDNDDIKRMSEAELLYAKHFFGYINMRVTNLNKTMEECLGKFYLEDIKLCERCGFDLDEYFKQCAEVETIYEEIKDENIDKLKDEVIEISTCEKIALSVLQLTPYHLLKSKELLGSKPTSKKSTAC